MTDTEFFAGIGATALVLGLLYYVFIVRKGEIITKLKGLFGSGGKTKQK